jgi:uncharacterized membrane protein
MTPELGNGASPVFFDAVLSPHRSLPPKGFAVVMVLLAAVSFAVSFAFVLRGAWPVTPFFGLDVLLVYVAFRASYRQAKLREEVRLTADSLTVERVSVKGERKRWQFQPFWLRVTLEEKDEHTNRLLLISHGRALALGSFLGPAERRRVALALKDALARWRARLVPRSS